MATGPRPTVGGTGPRVLRLGREELTLGEVIAFRSVRSRRAAGVPAAAVPAAVGPTAAPGGRPEPTTVAAPRPANPGAGNRPEPLWREVAGSVLRDERRRQRRTLAQVAERAGMSVQYLSELERGRKEASSEMLGAACGSLGLGLGEFAARCARAITSAAARPSGPVLLAA